MGLAGSFIAFVFACAAATMTLMMGFSLGLAFLAYSGVGAVSLVLIVLIGDQMRRMSEKTRTETDVKPVASPIQ